MTNTTTDPQLNIIEIPIRLKDYTQIIVMPLFKGLDLSETELKDVDVNEYFHQLLMHIQRRVDEARVSLLVVQEQKKRNE